MEQGLDLGINGYASFELFGKTFWLTNTHISVIIVVLVITILAIIANRIIRKADPSKEPGKALNVIELVVDAIDSITRSNMGDKHFRGFCNYIGTLMIFLVLSNTVGIFGLRPPTADYGITFGLAIITFFLIHINGFRYQKMKHLTDLFDQSNDLGFVRQISPDHLVSMGQGTVQTGKSLLKTLFVPSRDDDIRTKTGTFHGCFSANSRGCSCN